MDNYTLQMQKWKPLKSTGNSSFKSKQKWQEVTDIILNSRLINGTYCMP